MARQRISVVVEEKQSLVNMVIPSVTWQDLNPGIPINVYINNLFQIRIKTLEPHGHGRNAMWLGIDLLRSMSRKPAKRFSRHIKSVECLISSKPFLNTPPQIDVGVQATGQSDLKERRLQRGHTTTLLNNDDC